MNRSGDQVESEHSRMKSAVRCRSESHYGGSSDGRCVFIPVKVGTSRYVYQQEVITIAIKEARTTFIVECWDVPLLRILRESGMSGRTVRDGWAIYHAVTYF